MSAKVQILRAGLIYHHELQIPTIQAVIFDLGRVIVPFDFERGYQKLAALSLLSTNEIRDRIRSTGLVPRFETGLVDPEPFVAGIAKALGIRLHVKEFGEIWNSIFLPETLIPESMLINLKRRYRLILLSNTNALHFDGLETAYPLLRHFDEHVLSYRVQVMKPDPRIYLHAATVAGCAPASVPVYRRSTRKCARCARCRDAGPGVSLERRVGAGFRPSWGDSCVST